MAAAAAAKVLRGGRSGFSSRLLGSSTALKGQWRNPVLSEGGNINKVVPERMEQLCSKRSLHAEPEWEPEWEPVRHHPMVIICLVGSGFGLLYTLPTIYRSAKACFKVYK